MQEVKNVDEIYLTWGEFDKAALEIADTIRLSKFNPELIIGIPRGGLVLAVKLSHLLNIPLEISTEPNIYKKVRDQRVLLVDDISDTGKELTYQLAKYKLYHTHINETLRLVTLYEREGTVVPVDFKYRHLNATLDSDDYKWIHFPWEK